MKELKTAYILLWFPKPSETFIFREVICLRDLGLPLKVFSLYGRVTKGLSPEMAAVARQTESLGWRYLHEAPAEIGYWWSRNPSLVRQLMGAFLIRRWRGLEKTGENFWAFLAAFRLARRFEEEDIRHIHAPWAGGPATAAWIASKLTGLPFSFTARAWDIHPPDSVLKEKIEDAAFIRSETLDNIKFLTRLVGGNDHKFHLTYNGVTLKTAGRAVAALTPPIKLLVLGRFVAKKGYDYLLKAGRLLLDRGLDFRLTMAGDGPLKLRLKRQVHRLGLTNQVHFPGFITHDQVSRLFTSADIFIMPSVVAPSGDQDGLPLVLMEALLHGLPVIATDVAGIPELIEDGVTGLLVRQKDPSELAEAILRLAADRTKALAMAENGRARVQERFDPEKNYRRVFELYRGALTTSGDKFPFVDRSALNTRR